MSGERIWGIQYLGNLAIVGSEDLINLFHRPDGLGTLESGRKGIIPSPGPGRRSARPFLCPHPIFACAHAAPRTPYTRCAHPPHHPGARTFAPRTEYTPPCGWHIPLCGKHIPMNGQHMPPCGLIYPVQVACTPVRVDIPMCRWHTAPCGLMGPCAGGSSRDFDWETSMQVGRVW